MDKKTFYKFAKLVGNEADLIPLENEKYDMAMPDNWDEMSPEDQATWKEKHMMKANEQIEPAAQPAAIVTPAKTVGVIPNAAQPAKVEIPVEIAQLTGLVKEVGGVDALKTLLVNAAKVSISAQATEDQERTSLTEVIKTNSADFTDDELKEMPIGTLRKVANSVRPIAVDYSGFSPRMTANAKDQIAPRPSLLLNQQAKTN
jgi:hypothetical protein